MTNPTLSWDLIPQAMLRRSITDKYAVQPSIQVCAETCGAKCCRVSSKTQSTVVMSSIFMRSLQELATARDIEVHFLNVGRESWHLQFDNDGACPFLDSDNLCSIYEDRPLACRVFPEEPSPDCLVWPLKENDEPGPKQGR